MAFSHGSKNRLTSHDLGRFEGDTLFDRIARVVCRIGLLPRKELFEAWEVARRTRRHCRGGRVVDVAGGHGLLAHIMLLLDDTPTAVLPCCHDLVTCDPGPLTGWMDGALAIDAMRAIRLADAGFTVKTQTIPPTITPKNRLLIALPGSAR